MSARRSDATPAGQRNRRRRSWVHEVVHVPGQLELPLTFDRELAGLPAEQPGGNAAQQRPEIDEEG